MNTTTQIYIYRGDVQECEDIHIPGIIVGG